MRRWNTPTPSTFVGREQELGQIVEILTGPVRLLTLIGPGGIGKTSLAAEVMQRYRGTAGRPVHWVRLARLKTSSDSDVIEHEISQAVVGIDFSNRSPWDAMVDTFTATPPLLVLDNCEHVESGVGDVVERLLDAVPDLTIVATSRKAIGWVDERRFTVPPLTHLDAVALFRQRAELTEHPVATGDDRTVSAICHRLDNHPLYVRLAAARLIRRSPEMILAELDVGSGDDRRLEWADGPAFGGDPRHTAVADVIAWSYDLCSPQERLLFERLSVFVAGTPIEPRHGARLGSRVGVDLEAVRAVCSGADATGTVDLPPERIPALLDNLVDHSLVSMHVDRTTVSYSLLECTRVFAEHRLRERSTVDVDEPQRLAHRFLLYYRDKLEFVAGNWYGTAESDLYDWAAAAWDNIRSAVELAIATPDEVIAGLRMCHWVLGLRLPLVMGACRETRRLTEQALQHARTLAAPPTDLIITTMAQLVLIDVIQGDRGDTAGMLDECVAMHFATVASTESPTRWRDSADTDIGLPPAVEVAWGHELIAHRDPRAITVLERAARKCEQSGDLAGASYWGQAAGMAAALLSPNHPAVHRAERAVADGAGSARATCWAQVIRAIAMTNDGDPEQALELESRALTALLEVRDEAATLWALHARIWSLARLIADLAAQERPDRERIVALAFDAAELTGGVSAWRAARGVRIAESGPFRDESVRADSIVRQALGDERYLDATSRGTRLHPQRDVDASLFALATRSAGSGIRRPRSNTGALWQQLTQAEQDVALLASRGLRNVDIAMWRGSSRKTVDAQIAAVLKKLAIASRARIAEFVPAELRRRETLSD
ncbi:ATP-binding protein [Nocardia sp. NPDC052566]|uniref:ATP-binding protein n=1 Tax=Nocardia sp. NPDC052566 TaxID=3364330 RepID=UPI0037C7E4B9